MRLRGVAPAAAASLVVATCGVEACGGAHSAPGAGPSVALPAPSPRGPVYRFIPSGSHAVANLVELPGGLTAVSGAERRTIVHADGTMELPTAVDREGRSAGGSAFGGVAVPSRLGGGYLFWSSELEHTATFLGPRRAVAPLYTNVIDVEFGHDFLFLYGPDQPRRAWAIDPPREVPFSPHGVVAIAGADDDRVVALDAVGRALVSLDGAKTWKDVTRDLHGAPERVTQCRDWLRAAVGVFEYLVALRNKDVSVCVRA